MMSSLRSRILAMKKWSCRFARYSAIWIARFTHLRLHFLSQPKIIRRREKNNIDFIGFFKGTAATAIAGGAAVYTAGGAAVYLSLLAAYFQ